MFLVERDHDPADTPDYAYYLTVSTYRSQTPDPAATEAAIRAQKPGGIVLTYRSLDGQTYDQVRTQVRHLRCPQGGVPELPGGLDRHATVRREAMSHTTPVYALPYPDETDTADVPRDVQALAQRIEAVLPLVGEPTGSGIDWYSPGAAPAGFLLCDGSAVNRTTYAALFAVLGTTWGGGDGVNTFNLPDTRGRVLVGFASGGHADVATVGANDGAALASRTPKHNSTVQGAPGVGSLALPNHGHAHSLTLPDHGHTANLGTFSAAYGDQGTWYNDRGGASMGVGSATSFPRINGSVDGVSSAPGISGAPSVGNLSVGPGGSRAIDTPSYVVAQKAIRT